jgi:metal-responsive CopG/Arc/MetJ family transcriptional regulator
MTKRIIISIPQELLDIIKGFCTDKGYNRSEFFRYAARKIIKNENKVSKEKQA